ncbi:MAG: hypothetical protein JWR05_3479 [Mucilaginibacter sp.]|nr:hypothetical protein [Mucilaginibacter sp.]
MGKGNFIIASLNKRCKIITYIWLTMKTVEEQKFEKATKIAGLIIEQAIAVSKAINPELSDEERQLNAKRAILINDVELPLVIQTPIMLKEYPKGGVTFAERGP